MTDLDHYLTGLRRRRTLAEAMGDHRTADYVTKMLKEGGLIVVPNTTN